MQRAEEPDATELEAVRAWAASGAMALTGWPDEAPLGPPAGLVPAVQELGRRLAAHGLTAIDPLALLGERAAIAGLGRGGRVSCGGATRLVRTADGWLAVALARDEDVALLPAWLGIEPVPAGGDPWPAVEGAVGRLPADVLAEGAALLGLPIGRLPEGGVPDRPPVAAQPVPGTADRTGPRGLLVVDLGALWAAPLCTSLLLALGARVVKVESTARPDGARRGPAPFHDLLNAGKASVALDLTTGGGRTALHRLLDAADVVVEASRPRALRGLGVDAEALVAGGGPRVWVSITGYGRAGPGEHRVAFGDDAAVGGGLVARDPRGAPVFCADAVADPLTGLSAAVAALDALAAGGRWILDVALAAVAASAAGPTLPVPPGVEAAAPRARSVAGTAATLGADTGAVLAGLPG